MRYPIDSRPRSTARSTHRSGRPPADHSAGAPELGTESPPGQRVPDDLPFGNVRDRLHRPDQDGQGADRDPRWRRCPSTRRFRPAGTGRCGTWPATSGWVQRWASDGVGQGRPPGDGDVEDPPDRDDDWASWIRAGVEALVETLVGLDPASPTWHPFTVDHGVHGVAPPSGSRAVDPPVGRPGHDRVARADRSRHGERWHRRVLRGGAGPLVFSASRRPPGDEPARPLHRRRRRMDGTGGRTAVLTMTREHAKGDAALRGRAEDLLLTLWRQARPGRWGRRGGRSGGRRRLAGGSAACEAAGSRSNRVGVQPGMPLSPTLLRRRGLWEASARTKIVSIPPLAFASAAGRGWSGGFVSMSIAITEDHRALAGTVADLLDKHEARAAARELLEADVEPLPSSGTTSPSSGGSGSHVPEKHGGSGSASPSSSSSSRSSAARSRPVRSCRRDRQRRAGVGAGARRRKRAAARPRRRLDASAAVALDADVEVRDGAASRRAEVVGGGLADMLLVAAGDDVAVVDARAGGVEVEYPANLDPTRRAARVTLDGAPAEVAVRRRPAAGRPRPHSCSRPRPPASPGSAPSWPPSTPRCAMQFGRPIAMYQAVKHHCANMLVAAELATAAVWDAARAAAGGGDQFTYTAAVGRRAGDPGGRLVRQAQHPGARRHRLHVGARRPPLPAAGDRDRGGDRRRGGGREEVTDSCAGASAAPIGRPAARGRARCATRCGSSPPASPASTTRPRETALIDVRLRDAALARAVGPRRRRGRAARRSSRSSRPPASSGPRTASPAG